MPNTYASDAIAFPLDGVFGTAREAYTFIDYLFSLRSSTVIDVRSGYEEA